MSNYLGHEFAGGKCARCGAVEKSVRQFQAPCAKASTPSNSLPVPDVAHPPQKKEEESQPSVQSPVSPKPLDGGIWEYRILSQRDQLFSGRFDSASITEVLNQLAEKGWRVICVTSAGVNTLLGGNRDEIMIFLERKKDQK